MSIAASMLPEFDHETANTRKMLERVPEAKFGWKPHEKSFTLGQLASHLANVPTWMAPTILQSELDFAPVGGEPFTTPQASSTAELVKFFDDNTAAAREVFADAADATFMENWSLLGGGQVYFTMPKIAVVRSFIMNHMIHHRAQLSVYLRMLDVPVPGMYGPSADEGM